MLGKPKDKTRNSENGVAVHHFIGPSVPYNGIRLVLDGVFCVCPYNAQGNNADHAHKRQLLGYRSNSYQRGVECEYVLCLRAHCSMFLCWVTVQRLVEMYTRVFQLPLRAL